MRLFALELVHEVLEYLADDRATLLSCSLVSKNFRNAGRPVMWRVLVVRKQQERRHRISFAQISTTPDISKHVKEINFDIVSADASCIKVECITKLLSEFQFFPNFKNLAALRIFFPHRAVENFYLLPSLDKDDRDWSSSPSRRLQSDVLRMLAKIHLDTGFHVNTLELHRLFAFPNAGVYAPGLQSFLAPLKTLYVSLIGVGSDEKAEYDAWELYDRFMEDLMVIFKAPNSLESFTYSGDRFAHGLTAAQWDQLTYPNLKHICLEDIILGNICILGTAQSEAHDYSCFIVRHKATLERLELRSCVRHISNLRSNNDPAACVTWGDLFDIFSAKLERLVEFTIDPLPGRNAEKDRDFYGCYMWYDDQGGYRTHFRDDPVDQVADRLALSQFQATLAERRRGYL